MKKKTLMKLGAVAGIAGLLLTACADGGDTTPPVSEGDLIIDGELIATADVWEAAKGEGTLVFYTGGSEQSERGVIEAFTELTGIQVELVRLAPARLTERILAEVATNNLGGDVIRTSGEDLTLAILEAGAFAKVELPADTAAAVADSILDDGLYFNSFDRVYTFAYNNQVVSEADAPKNWADIVDPKWNGKTSIVQVGAGGSTAALTRFHLDVMGEDWLRAYAATDPMIFDTVAGQTDALARGEIQVATVPIATGYGAIQSGAPITIATPSEGAAAYPFYVAAASSQNRPNASAVFVTWLMSKNGQALASSSGDYPVRADVASPSIGGVQLPSVDSGFIYRADMETTLRFIEEDAALWREIFDYQG